LFFLRARGKVEDFSAFDFPGNTKIFKEILRA